MIRSNILLPLDDFAEPGSARALRTQAELLVRYSLAARIGMQAGGGFGTLLLATLSVREELAAGIVDPESFGFRLAHAGVSTQCRMLLRRRVKLLATADRAIERLSAGDAPHAVAATLAVLARCAVIQSRAEHDLWRPKE